MIHLLHPSPSTMWTGTLGRELWLKLVLRNPWEWFSFDYLSNHHEKITKIFFTLIFRQLVSLLRINQINELGIQHDSKFNFEEIIWLNLRFVENITTDGNTVGLLLVPNDKGVDCIYISEVDRIRTDSKLIIDTATTNSIYINGHLPGTIKVILISFCEWETPVVQLTKQNLPEKVLR